MKYIIFSILLLMSFSINVKAHECILTGTSAKEITIYNTCLAHSKQNKPKNKPESDPKNQIHKSGEIP